MLNKRLIIIGTLALILIFGTVYRINAPTVQETIETKKQVVENLNFNPEIIDNFNSLSHKNIGWGIKKEKGAEPFVYEKTKKLFSETNTIYLGKKEKTMYLTFDEGYENGYTDQILDILKSEKVPAMFFVTGPYLKTETALIDRMVNEGHIVGNHTTGHINLAKSDNETIFQDLKALNDDYKKQFGYDMKYIRPPEGEYSEYSLHLLNAMGYKTILWSLAYKDWERDVTKGTEYTLNQLVPYFHDGAIILLHAVSADNANALSKLISEAKNQGYTFKSIDDIFN